MLKRIIIALLSATLFLPIAEMVMLGLARLLTAMGDETGALALDRIALGGGALWLLALIALVVVVALQTLVPPTSPPDKPH
jgi:hypothetical protein